jgi:aspartokinase/homoserine dehydrogenase 1
MVCVDSLDATMPAGRGPKSASGTPIDSHVLSFVPLYIGRFGIGGNLEWSNRKNPLGLSTAKATSRVRRARGTQPRQLLMATTGANRRNHNELETRLDAVVGSMDRNPNAAKHQIPDASGLLDRHYGGTHYLVHKFGGSSLADAPCFEQVLRVLEKELARETVAMQQIAQGAGRDPLQCRLFVVVSAVGGVTNTLERALQCAVQRDRDEHYLEVLQKLQERHETLAHALLSSNEAKQPFMAMLSSSMQDLKDLLRAAYISRSASGAVRDLVLGYGELWSAQLMWALLRQQQRLDVASGQNTAGSIVWLDARNVIAVRRIPTMPSERKSIDWNLTEQLFEEWMTQHSGAGVVVATGFLAMDADRKVPTTLGRNGSDFSAAIFARLARSPSCTIWTDVDGVYSADPRCVPDAIIIPRLSFKEAAELAYFGAKVLHPDTLTPVVASGTPVRIRNTFHPEKDGTEILPARMISRNAATAASQTDGNGSMERTNPLASLAARKAALGITAGVKGFTSVREISIVNVEGAGMIGVPGIASRAFAALYAAKVSVVLIAQASSEFSICVAVPGADGETAAAALRRAFRIELEDQIISSIELLPDCCILAMVGENMQNIPGVSSRLFTALANAGVNIRAIAQGSSEHNISVVIYANDEVRALRAAHAAFYLSDYAISVGVLGRGLVGSTLIDQMREQRAKLHDLYGVDFRIRGIASSSRMWLLNSSEDFHDADAPGRNWKERFDERAEPLDLERFVAHVNDGTLPHAVVADCTASGDIGAKYAHWLRAGVHLVTPNKKANTASMAYYREIREAMRTRNTHFFYEANVGAGLPIISSVRDLLRTGDAFLSIEGIFSGTLSYIFNSFDGSAPFSRIVQQAKELGYTEPDPREDLSGADVARKVVILGREVGLEIELEQINVQSLVPPELEASRGVSVSDFMQRLPEFDEELSRRVQEATSRDQVLRYVGVVDVQNCRCAVELRAYPRSHPFGGLEGSDNIVCFRTLRYDAQPLVVRGPGAGAQVTAAGVFADLLRLAGHLGAPSG